MKLKLRDVLALVIALFLFVGAPTVVIAQELPAGLEGETTIPNLPNDLADENNQEDTASDAADTKPLTQREDFLAGVGVGVVFGIIVGGAVIWFTKKS